MIHWWFTDLRTSKTQSFTQSDEFPQLRTDFLQTFFGEKTKGNHGILHDFTMEFLGKSMVFLVFLVVRFSDAPWEVAHCFHEIFHGKKPMVFLVVRFSPQSSPSLFTNGRIFHDFPAMAIKNGLMAGKMRWSQLIRGGQDSPWQNNCGFSETTSIVNDS